MCYGPAHSLILPPGQFPLPRYLNTKQAQRTKLRRVFASRNSRRRFSGSRTPWEKKWRRARGAHEFGRPFAPPRFSAVGNHAVTGEQAGVRGSKQGRHESSIGHGGIPLVPILGWGTSDCGATIGPNGAKDCRARPRFLTFRDHPGLPWDPAFRESRCPKKAGFLGGPGRFFNRSRRRWNRESSTKGKSARNINRLRARPLHFPEPLAGRKKRIEERAGYGTDQSVVLQSAGQKTCAFSAAGEKIGRFPAHEFATQETRPRPAREE